MILWWLSAAWAGPSLAVGVHQRVPDSELPQAVGIDGTAAIPVSGPVLAEVAGAFDPAERFAAALAGARWAPAVAGGLSISAGAGLAGIEALHPGVTGSVAFDVAFGPSWGMRLETRGWRAHDLATLQLGLSARWTLSRPEPEPLPAPVPLPESAAETPIPAPTAPLVVSPRDAMIWLPHPICAWIPASEAANWAALVGASQVRFSAPGFLPTDALLGGEVALAPAPSQGAFVVVAGPSDRVRVDEAPLPVGDDGVALVNATEGLHAAIVTGGGREVRLEAAVSAGYVTWVRAPDPPDVIVRFSAGSSVISAADRARLRALVPLAGDWAWRVAGSFSAEGDVADNQLLATERAEAVRAILIAAGAPAELVVVEAAFPPADGASVADQRVARLRPVGRAK